MYYIDAHSVNDAFLQGINYLDEHGEVSPSRNGLVKVAPVPVVTMTRNPQFRVLSIPGRGENPFFHFVESLWMLAGRNSLADLTTYVKQMAAYSDDGGKTQPGAYGHRWREAFGFDQLDWAVDRLRKDPNDRRVVVSMWDGTHDPTAADWGSKDVPCNTQIYLLVRRGCLEMTVTCRSNDAIWGAHGANAVHFSVLHEYLAGRLGLGIGPMYQFSNNYHMYLDKASPELLGVVRTAEYHDHCRYAQGTRPFPMFDKKARRDAWDEDLLMWWEEPTKTGLRHQFFRRVATPIVMAHKAYRKVNDKNRFTTAREIIAQCVADDWRQACDAWLLNQETKKQKAAA